MKQRDESALRLHLLQYRLATWLQIGALIGGLIGAAKHGFPAIVAGCFGAWVFHLIKPGPVEHLDRVTGRDKPG